MRKRIEKDTLITILDCCIEDDCEHCPNAYKDSSIAACEAIARGSVNIPFAIMRETINALKAQPQWINVKDRLPGIDENVLILYESKVSRETGCAITCLKDSFYFGGKPISYKTPQWAEPWQYFRENNVITHWMSLPEPPGDGGAAG